MGFIGSGQIGSAIVRLAIEAGHQVVLRQRTIGADGHVSPGEERGQGESDSSGRTFCVFELGPHPGDGSDVIVVEGIDEVLLDRIFEGSFDRLGEVPSALGEADERHPTVALVGSTLEVPGIDQFLNQP